MDSEREAELTDGLYKLARALHLQARDHHRAECRCDFCRSDGRELCEEDRPCTSCRERQRRRPA